MPQRTRYYVVIWCHDCLALLYELRIIQFQRQRLKAPLALDHEQAVLPHLVAQRLDHPLASLV